MPLLFYNSYTVLPFPLEIRCVLPILTGHGARGKLERCCMGRMAEAKYQAARFNIKTLEAWSGIRRSWNQGTIDLIFVESRIGKHIQAYRVLNSQRNRFTKVHHASGYCSSLSYQKPTEKLVAVHGHSLLLSQGWHSPCGSILKPRSDTWQQHVHHGVLSSDNNV